MPSPEYIVHRAKLRDIAEQLEGHDFAFRGKALIDIAIAERLERIAEILERRRLPVPPNTADFDLNEDYVSAYEAWQRLTEGLQSYD